MLTLTGGPPANSTSTARFSRVPSSCAASSSATPRAIVSSVLKAIYIRSMRGVDQVAWMEDPFSNEREYTAAGRVMLRIWLCSPSTSRIRSAR